MTSFTKPALTGKERNLQLEHFYTYLSLLLEETEEKHQKIKVERYRNGRISITFPDGRYEVFELSTLTGGFGSLLPYHEGTSANGHYCYPLDTYRCILTHLQYERLKSLIEKLETKKD